MQRDDEENSGPLLPVRTALVLLLAVVAGGVAGGLTGLARHSPYEALLVGLTTVALATRFFHWLIADR